MVSSKVISTSCTASGSEPTGQGADRARRWRQLVAELRSIAFTRSMTLDRVRIGLALDFSTMDRLPRVQLAVRLFSTDRSPFGDVAQAHRLAAARGDDEAGELVSAVELGLGLDGQVRSFLITRLA
jgi:hypothetical protein